MEERDELERELDDVRGGGSPIVALVTAVESVPTVMVAGVEAGDGRVSEDGMGMVEVASGRGDAKEPVIPVSLRLIGK